jgi:hypothetical protein
MPALKREIMDKMTATEKRKLKGLISTHNKSVKRMTVIQARITRKMRAGKKVNANPGFAAESASGKTQAALWNFMDAMKKKYGSGKMMSSGDEHVAALVAKVKAGDTSIFV